MAENLIDDEYLSQEMADMNADLDDLIAKLKLRSVNLTDEQREMQHAADKRKEFTHKGINYSENDSRLVPPTSSVDKVKRDRIMDRQLEGIKEKVKIALGIITDTQVAAQIDEYSYALDVYSIAQTNEKLGIQGMKPIVDDMGELFKSQGNRRPKPPTT